MPPEQGEKDDQVLQRDKPVKAAFSGEKDVTRWAERRKKGGREKELEVGGRKS